jgi:hypothetical protein
VVNHLFDLRAPHQYPCPSTSIFARGQQDAEMNAKQNLGWQRFVRIMREWGIMALLMLALHALFFFNFWLVMEVLRVREATFISC